MSISTIGIQIKRISLPRMAWLLVAMIMCWHFFFVSLNPENRDRIIQSDGSGYYAYLPAIFIYHDLTYEFCSPDSPEYPGVLAADNRLFINTAKDGTGVNKYFIGTAVLESPFFLIACAAAPVFGFECDGYSLPFQIAIALAGIFYALLGLEFVRRLLNKRGFPGYVQAITILLLFLGTNLYHYTIEDPGMSHAFSFAMMSLFLWVSHNLFHDRKTYTALWVVLTLTAVIAIRPVNGIIVCALPFMAGSWKYFRDGIRFSFGNRRVLIFGLAFFTFVVFLQLLMYKISSGKWFADSYAGEYFDLTNPHIMNVLFSWRKGFLIYTPLMAVALAGILLLKNNFERIAFFVFFLSALWVMSSWQQWWYGGSLGMRPMIDFYPVLAIPLATIVYAICRTWWARIVTTPIILFIVVLNLVQHYQFAMAILPYDEMNQERYERIFFKTNKGYSFIYDPGWFYEHYIPDGSQILIARMRTFEEDTTGRMISYWQITNQRAFEGKNCVKLDTGELTAGLSVMLNDVVPDTSVWSKLWIRIKAKVSLPLEEFGPCMVLSIRSDGKEYDWQACKLIFKVEPGYAWQDFSYDVKFPPPPGGNVELCTFLLHGDKSVAYADNMEMEFWAEP